MKKRLVLVIVVLVLSLTFILAGCNLFTTNVERDGDQVVATVKHNGLVGEVTKKEFINYFNQNYQQYNSYFKWTVEEAGETFISILARRKMTLIVAVEYLANKRGVEVNKDKFNAIIAANTKNLDKPEDGSISLKGYDVYSAYLLSLLNVDEQKYVKEQTNKMFQDVYEEDVKTAIENAKIKEEENNSNSNKDDDSAKDPRPTKDKDDDTEFKPDPSVPDDFDVNSIKTFFEEFKPNDASTSYEKDAYRKRERALKQSYLTYDYYLAQQAESRIMTKYQESDDFKDKTTNMEIKVSKHFDKLMYDQQKSYEKSSSDYKSALEGDNVIVFHNGQFVQLKSILLQFSDEQKAALEYINNYYSGVNGKEMAIKLREALVFGKLDSSLNIPDVVSATYGLKVYRSNKDYDPTKPAGDPAKNYEMNSDGTYKLENGKPIGPLKPAEEMNYPYIVNPDYDPTVKDSDKWQSEQFTNVIAELGAALIEAEKKAETEYKDKYKDKYDENDNAYVIGKKMFINQKKAELFEDWIYLVNDDPGMFEGKEYVETPKGNSSDYVVEFTALVRTLLADNNVAGKGATGSVMIDASQGADIGGDYTSIVKNIVEVEKFENNIAKKETVAIYTDTTNNISFVINEFGVHLVMLTSVPVDYAYNTIGEDSTHTIIKSENTEFDMGLFENSTSDFRADMQTIKDANAYYAYTLNTFVDFDEEEGKAITLEKLLNDQLKETYDSTAYSKHTTKLFEMYGEDLFDKKDDKEASEGYADLVFEEIKLNKSVYNKIINSIK